MTRQTISFAPCMTASVSSLGALSFGIPRSDLPHCQTVGSRSVSGYQSVLTGALRDFAPDLQANWRLRQPFVVDVERDEQGAYVVSDDDFLVYGSGPTVRDACQDFVVSLVEYYELVAASDDPYDQAELRRLQAYIQP
jgi:hypothetical protein